MGFNSGFKGLKISTQNYRTKIRNFETHYTCYAAAGRVDMHADKCPKNKRNEVTELIKLSTVSRNQYKTPVQ